MFSGRALRGTPRFAMLSARHLCQTLAFCEICCCPWAAPGCARRLAACADASAASLAGAAQASHGLCMTARARRFIAKRDVFCHGHSSNVAFREVLCKLMSQNTAFRDVFWSRFARNAAFRDAFCAPPLPNTCVLRDLLLPLGRSWLCSAPCGLRGRFCCIAGWRRSAAAGNPWGPCPSKAHTPAANPYGYI